MGEGEGSDDVFVGPTVLDELEGEVIEEFGMAWGFATRAEVVDTSDEAFTEEFLPDAVHGDPRGEGVALVGDPVGEFETTALVRRDFRLGLPGGDPDETAGDGFAEGVGIASDGDAHVGGGFDVLDGEGVWLAGVEIFAVAYLKIEVLDLGIEFVALFLVLGFGAVAKAFEL